MNDYDLFIKYLFAKADKSRVPLSGSFELTPRCTLDCKMCYIHKRSEDAAAKKLEKDAQWWLKLAGQAKKAGTLLLLLTGGEPMIRSDFAYIYTQLLNMGFLMSINTNATLIDEEKINLFIKNPPQRINVTLYGMSRETYFNLCGSADAYDKVMSALGMLKSAGINVRINYTVTPLNASDMTAAQEFARENNFGFQAVTYSFPRVRTLEKCENSLHFNAEDAAKMHFLYMKNALGEDGLRQAAAKFSDSCSLGSLMHGECGDIPSGKINCRAGTSSYWVTYDGRMTPCGMMNAPDVKIDDFDTAWSKTKLNSDGIMLSGKCLNCDKLPICDFCAACAKAETGKFDLTPDYACRKATVYYKLCKDLLNR